MGPGGAVVGCDELRARFAHGRLRCGFTELPSERNNRFFQRCDTLLEFLNPRHHFLCRKSLLDVLGCGKTPENFLHSGVFFFPSLHGPAVSFKLTHYHTWWCGRARVVSLVWCSFRRSSIPTIC